MAISTFRFPTSIDFGENAIKGLGKTLQQANCSRPLILCDAQLVELEPTRRLIQECEQVNLAYRIHHESEGNPTLDHVASGVSLFHEHRADSIIGIGGGCALDVAKAVRLMVDHPDSSSIMRMVAQVAHPLMLADYH